MRIKSYISLLIITASLFSACKKSTDGNKPAAAATTPDYYFKGTINGQVVSWLAANNGKSFAVGAAAETTRNVSLVTGGISALISADDASKLMIGVEFRTFQTTANMDIPAYFKSFVATGSWPYATDPNFIPNQKATVIFYTDNNGKAYSSMGPQNGGNVNILSVTPLIYVMGFNDCLKIKLTFSNCTVYPLDGKGSSIPITNAEATVLLADFLY